VNAMMTGTLRKSWLSDFFQPVSCRRFRCASFVVQGIVQDVSLLIHPGALALSQGPGFELSNPHGRSAAELYAEYPSWTLREQEKAHR